VDATLYGARGCCCSRWRTTELGSIYNSDSSVDEKRASKKLLLDQLAEDYAALYQAGQNSGQYSRWLSSGLNNAKLTTVITYQDYVAGFLALYNHVGENHQNFYKLVQKLSICDKVRRKSILEEKVTDFQC